MFNRAYQLRVTKMAKVGGGTLGLAGGFLSGYQYYKGQISGYEFSTDLVMTGVGFFGGRYGSAASSIYFVGKPIYNYLSPENPLFAPPKD